MTASAVQSGQLAIGFESFSRDQCPAIQEELRQRIASGETNLVLDMREVRAISPSAIYLLLAANRSLRDKDGRIALVNLQDEIRHLLTGLHLDEALGLS